MAFSQALYEMLSFDMPESSWNHVLYNKNSGMELKSYHTILYILLKDSQAINSNAVSEFCVASQYCFIWKDKYQTMHA